MKKGILFIIGMVLCVASVQAVEFFDDFNRPSTSSTNKNPKLIGPNWETSNTNNIWRLAGAQLEPLTAEWDHILYNTTVSTSSGDGKFFEVGAELTVKPAGDGHWIGGLAWNVQDADNYYYLRIKADSGGNNYIQLYATIAGTVESNKLASVVLGTGTFATDMSYTLTVRSEMAYGFAYEIKETSSGTVVADGQVTDSSSQFTGGYGGILQSDPSTSISYDSFDNFRVESDGITEILISDNFNRADTALYRDASIPGQIGANWRGGEPLDFCQIDDNQLDTQLNNGDGVFYNVGLETASGGGTNFTVSVDAKGNPDGNGHWIGGAAFNVQDGGNWYAIRFKSESQHLQFAKSVGGSVSATGSIFPTLPNPSFLEDTYYTITVSSSAAGVFEVDVREKGSSTAIYNGTINDPWAGGGVLSGGYGGVYATENGALGSGDQKQSFDNYSLVVGLPATFGYGAWAATWGVNIGAEEEDYDSDELINLHEYGLGGNPTDPLDQGVAPELVFGAGAVDYIFPQLSDTNSGLAYSIELREDLITGSWSNMGYTITGTNVTGGDLDLVTNATGAAEDTKFIRLRIEQD